MLTSARSRQRIIRLAALIALAGCKAEPPAARRDDAPVTAAPPRDAANAITIRPEPPRAPGDALARRCVFDGDPLVAGCGDRGSGLAWHAGTLYVVAGEEVRRYARAEGDGCRYTPAGAPIALPPVQARPQSLDGPVYMRSGGPEWNLTVAGGAVYAFDYLAGLFRFERGAARPACVDVFGYSSVVAHGKQLLVNRRGIEQLALGKRCTASSAKIDDKARGALYSIAGALHVASGGGALARYDGASRTEIAKGARVCSISAVVACGDGACIVDNNCMQVIQLDGGGAPLRTIEGRRLFGARPWGLGGAVAGAGGAVLVHARHRDRAGDQEICETAIYELPAALFAL